MSTRVMPGSSERVTGAWELTVSCRYWQLGISLGLCRSGAATFRGPCTATAASIPCLLRLSSCDPSTTSIRWDQPYRGRKSSLPQTPPLAWWPRALRCSGTFTSACRQRAIRKSAADLVSAKTPCRFEQHNQERTALASHHSNLRTTLRAILTLGTVVLS